ncbi:MAG: hypothetical protein ABIJ34_02755 [archaeon]
MRTSALLLAREHQTTEISQVFETYKNFKFIDSYEDWALSRISYFSDLNPKPKFRNSVTFVWPCHECFWHFMALMAQTEDSGQRLKIEKSNKEVRILSKKDSCKQLMGKFFGPASAALVDSMSEEECVAKCRAKVAGFLGEDKAKEFDKI